MANFTVKLLGMRASLFASGRRAGVEFTVPIDRLRRGRIDVAQVPAPAPPPPEGNALARQVAAIEWYHSIDLGGGVVTPGYYDHGPILGHYQLPERMDGMRVLDIASFDGFWAFEFERRGAAEVVALDIRTAGELDLPWRVRAGMGEAELGRRFGAGFALAHATLGSRVQHEHCNVYDLTPERLGQFDLVHCGDLLLHLRDPMGALMRIRGVTRGQALISDVIYPDFDRHDGLPLVMFNGGRGDNIWWRLGANALRQMIEDSGFDRVEELSRFRYGARGQPPAMWHAVFQAAP
jgi:tRNA (mo5U34)-methyltransferase